MHSGKLPENDCQHDRLQQRLNDGPCRARHSLLVAHRDVPPRENQEELPVIKQVAPVIPFRPSAFYDQCLHLKIFDKLPHLGFSQKFYKKPLAPF